VSYWITTAIPVGNCIIMRSGSSRKHLNLRGHSTSECDRFVTYTGDNNVTYTKTCEPHLSDISVQSIDAVYLPDVRHSVQLQNDSYPYQYFAAGPSRVTTGDGIHQCVHCKTSGTTEVSPIARIVVR